MSKGLEDLKWLVENGYIKRRGWPEDAAMYECVNNIEEELKLLDHERELNDELITHEVKALEIIIELKINLVIFIGSDSVEEYNKHPLTYRKLIQEQFDFLKEILK